MDSTNSPWYVGQDFWCPYCHVEQRIESSGDVILSPYQSKFGGMAPNFQTRCGACRRKFWFTEERIGPFWKRRFFTEPYMSGVIQ